ncbi:MAG TPA: T9SS type A sorting domain-containing protein, partial [Chitinophagales bacterium]|nr:T9SS type A sorting domain-containing protein [Chitinophagales bacterium]
STHGPFGSNSPGKCGINLAVVDGGSMENILIENINISGVNTPVCIRLGNRANKYTDTAAVPGVGYMRDVELRNIIINASSDSASSITGIPGYDARNIKLENIDVTYPGGWPSLGPGFVVPENISAGPEATLFGDSLPASGLFIRHIDSLQMHNVCFHAIQPDSRPDFYLDDVNNLDTAGLCGSVENVTAIQQPGLSNDIAVYPNPVLNTFQIKTDNSWLGASYKLFDINGKIVLQGIIRLNKQTVEGNQVPAGLYLLQLAKGAHMASKRVLKM